MIFLTLQIIGPIGNNYVYPILSLCRPLGAMYLVGTQQGEGGVWHSIHHASWGVEPMLFEGHNRRMQVSVQVA